MAKHIRCGKLFTGLADKALSDQTVVVEGTAIAHVGPTAEAPEPAAGDSVVDLGAMTWPRQRETVQALIADAREEGFRIVPACSYVAQAFRDHPEWSELKAAN